MSITERTTVGSVVTEHPLSARVFARHRIDFCCGGGKELGDACASQGVDTQVVLAELRTEIASRPDAGERWSDRPMNDLIEHILATFHGPLREELPRLGAMARKVHDVHGHRDPQRLKAIVDTLAALEEELLVHMQKEEQILFPMIATGRGAMAMGPVSVMEAEHAAAGDMLRRLRTLTDDYVPPADACNTWRALWAGLEALESDTHLHIHLENNILFPKALGDQPTPVF